MSVSYYLKYLLAGLVLLTTAAFGQKTSVRTFDRDSLRADALLMLKTFEEVQVNSFLHLSKSALMRKKDSIFNAIPKRVDQSKAFVVLSEIAALIKDAHTYVDNYAPVLQQYQQSKVFPLGIQYRKSDQSLIIANKFSRDGIVRPGAELISINGYNARELFHKATGLQGGLAAIKSTRQTTISLTTCIFLESMRLSILHTTNTAVQYKKKHSGA